MLLSAGRYKGRLESLTISETGKGKPQIEFRVLVREIEQDGEYAGIEAVRRTVYRYLTEDAFKSTLDDLKELGFASTSFDDLVTWDCSGIEVPLYSKHEEYQGKTQEKWYFNFRQAKQTDPEVAKKLKKDLGSMFAMGMKERLGNKATNTTSAPTTKTTAQQFEEAL